MMLDSDILIWLLRGRSDIIQQFRNVMGQVLFLTPIQIAEIYTGLRTGEKEKTDRFFECFTVLPIDKEMGYLAANWLQTYRKSHQLDLPDTLIAASVYQHHLKLWTLNQKHYPMLMAAQFYKSP